MSENAPVSDVHQLSVNERLRLIEELWDSLDQVPGAVAIPDWHRDELDARTAAHERDPGASLPWDEVKRSLLDALRR